MSFESNGEYQHLALTQESQDYLQNISREMAEKTRALDDVEQIIIQADRAACTERLASLALWQAAANIVCEPEDVVADANSVLEAREAAVVAGIVDEAVRKLDDRKPLGTKLAESMRQRAVKRRMERMTGLSSSSRLQFFRKSRRRGIEE